MYCNPVSLVYIMILLVYCFAFCCCCCCCCCCCITMTMVYKKWCSIIIIIIIIIIINYLIHHTFLRCCCCYCYRFDPHDELSALCTKLWDLDDNRLKPGIDYAIDLQGCECCNTHNIMCLILCLICLIVTELLFVIHCFAMCSLGLFLNLIFVAGIEG